MTRTKKVIYFILGLLALLLILSIILPKSTTTSTTRTIKAPQNYIYNIINDLSLYGQYTELPVLDTSFGQVCPSVTIGKDAHCSVKSRLYGNYEISINNPSDSSLTIVQSTANDTLKRTTYLIKGDKNNQTTITAHITKRTGLFKNLIHWITNWKLRSQEKRSLDGIEKMALERLNNKMYRGLEVVEIMIPPKSYSGLRASVDYKNINQYYTQNISSVYVKAQDAAIKTIGSPSALFFSRDDNTQKVDMSAAIPTLIDAAIKDTETTELPQSMAVRVVFNGARDYINRAHQAATDYMLDKKYTIRYPYIEEYLVQPDQEPDPNKWITNVYYYIMPIGGAFTPVGQK
jgi:effector-binding domain-containing protein